MIHIGITGKMGVGKSTLASLLYKAAQNEWPKLVIGRQSMADGVKIIAYKMGWNGEKDEKGRRLLQLLGTECGRKCISEDIWIKWYLREAEKLDICICDDVRFDNEATLFKEAPNILIKLTGKQRLPANYKPALFNHDSEKGVTLQPTFIFDNSADGLEHLALFVDAVILPYLKRSLENG